MAMAPVTYVLWQEYLRFDPEDPIWPNRDRFILSAGQASTSLSALLGLAGVKAVKRKYETLGELAVSLDDLRNFANSKAGHPEYHWTFGVGASRLRGGHQRRHRASRQMAGPRLQPARFYAV